MIPGVNMVLVGLILGVVIGNAVSLPDATKIGVKTAGSTLLETSIVLLAFGLNIQQMHSLGVDTLLWIVLSVTSVLIAVVLLSRVMKCPGSTGLLIGFGTAICGSSAIAAISPVVAKNKEDIGIALAVVNLIGGIAMIVMPFALSLFSLEIDQLALMIGATLHSVGNVAGAGYAMGEEVGLSSVSIKMIRVAMLAPAVLVFGFLNGNSKSRPWKKHLKLPFYLWLFIAVSVLVTLIELPSTFLIAADFGADFLLTTAMVAIGLNTGIKHLYQSGKRAIGFGLIIFTIQILIILGILIYK